MRPRKTGVLAGLALLGGAVLVGLLLFELAARGLLQKSPADEDILLGVILPPRSVIPSPSPHPVDPDTPYEGLIVDGQQITSSDLWGIVRSDPLVGYVPQENSASTNGWWRTNNVGARYDKDLAAGTGSGTPVRRSLFFGESFTQGSRLPQEDTWVYKLDGLDPDREAVNFGVDGYGMAQSLLRYLVVADRVPHDVVAFVFLPTADLWRDVNTIRSLAEPWHSFAVLPRFYPDGNELGLARSPYADVETLYAQNFPQLSAVLSAHLRQFDRFYLPMLYEPEKAHDLLVSARLVAAYRGKRRLQEIRRQAFYDPESEAWRTVRKIFRSAGEEATKRGADLAVIVMPTHDDVRTAADYSDFGNYWSDTVGRLRQSGLTTVDLLPAMSKATEDLDYGYDGSHYGPRASARIASILNKELSP